MGHIFSVKKRVIDFSSKKGVIDFLLKKGGHIFPTKGAHRFFLQRRGASVVSSKKGWSSKKIDEGGAGFTVGEMSPCSLQQHNYAHTPVGVNETSITPQKTAD